MASAMIVEPVRLANGNWKCSHRCKKCGHACCREGVKKKPKHAQLVAALEEGAGAENAHENVAVDEPARKRQKVNAKDRSTQPQTSRKGKRQEHRDLPDFMLDDIDQDRGDDELEDMLNARGDIAAEEDGLIAGDDYIDKGEYSVESYHLLSAHAGLLSRKDLDLLIADLPADRAKFVDLLASPVLPRKVARLESSSPDERNIQSRVRDEDSGSISPHVPGD